MPLQQWKFLAAFFMCTCNMERTCTWQLTVVFTQHQREMRRWISTWEDQWGSCSESSSSSISPGSVDVLVWAGLFPTNQPIHLLYGYVQAAFVDEHFDQDYNFCAVEEDPVTKKVIELTDQLQVDKQICSLHSSLSSVGAWILVGGWFLTWCCR